MEKNNHKHERRSSPVWKLHGNGDGIGDGNGQHKADVKQEIRHPNRKRTDSIGALQCPDIAEAFKSRVEGEEGRIRGKDDASILARDVSK